MHYAAPQCPPCFGTTAWVLRLLTLPIICLPDMRSAGGTTVPASAVGGCSHEPDCRPSGPLLLHSPGTSSQLTVVFVHVLQGGQRGRPPAPSRDPPPLLPFHPTRCPCPQTLTAPPRITPWTHALCKVLQSIERVQGPLVCWMDTGRRVGKQAQVGQVSWPPLSC